VDRCLPTGAYVSVNRATGDERWLEGAKSLVGQVDRVSSAARQVRIAFANYGASVGLQSQDLWPERAGRSATTTFQTFAGTRPI
jgi:hypothetical protein